MEPMPADLPPFRFLRRIRLLEIDAVTGMVKVTAESGEITYVQPAEAVKFAEWVQGRLDTEVREARQRLGQNQTAFSVSLWESAESPVPLATIPTVAKMPLSAMIFVMQQAHISRAGYALVSSDEIEAEFYHVKLTGGHV